MISDIDDSRIGGGRISHRYSQGDGGGQKASFLELISQTLRFYFESYRLRKFRSWQLQNSNELTDLDRTIEQSEQETSDR